MFLLLKGKAINCIKQEEKNEIYYLILFQWSSSPWWSSSRTIPLFWKFLRRVCPTCEDQDSGWPIMQGNEPCSNWSSGEDKEASPVSRFCLISPLIVITAVGTILFESFSSIMMERGCVPTETPLMLPRTFLIRRVPSNTTSIFPEPVGEIRIKFFYFPEHEGLSVGSQIENILNFKISPIHAMKIS